MDKDDTPYSRKLNRRMWLSVIVIALIVLIGGIAYVLNTSQNPPSPSGVVPGIGGGPPSPSESPSESPTFMPSPTP